MLDWEKIDNLRLDNWIRDPDNWGIIYFFGNTKNYIYFDNFYDFKRWLKIWKRLYHILSQKRRRRIVVALDNFIISDLIPIICNYI